MKLKQVLLIILSLGIIIIFSTPTISGVIKQNKIDSLKETASKLVQAAELKCQLEQVRLVEVIRDYHFIDGKVIPNLRVRTKIPKIGKILLDNKCNSKVTIYDSNYCVTKDYLDKNITILEKTLDDCKI